jgi:acetyl-CoA acetyltransferase
VGLSITATQFGWILVEGSAADGATLDHDAFDVDADTGTSQHAVAVRGAQAIAAATGHVVRSIGVTWSDDVETVATQLLESLRASGYDNLVEVPLPNAAQGWKRVTVSLKLLRGVTNPTRTGHSAGSWRRRRCRAQRRPCC